MAIDVISILLLLTHIAISTHRSPTSSTTSTQSPPLTTTTIYQINQEELIDLATILTVVVITSIRIFMNLIIAVTLKPKSLTSLISNSISFIYPLLAIKSQLMISITKITSRIIITSHY
jgi:hypothetical protein